MVLDWLIHNKRKEYRIDLQKDHSFAIAFVQDGDLGVIPGIPLNISAGGAAAAFSEDLSSELAAKKIVELQITFAHSMKIISLQARILVSRIQNGRLLCRFQFQDSEEIRPLIEQSTEPEYLNRRQSYRVDMIEEADIEVIVGLGKHAPRGHVWDLSISGMGVLVTQEIAEELAEEKHVRLAFSLPGSDTSLSMRGEIVFRKPKDNMVIMGVKFEQSGLQSGVPGEDIISTFIMRQQQKVLQRRAHLKYS